MFVVIQAGNLVLGEKLQYVSRHLVYCGVRFYSGILKKSCIHLDINDNMSRAYDVSADVGLSFAIIAELSGRRKRQHVIAHSGMRIIFCMMMMEILMKKKILNLTMMMTMTMTLSTMSTMNLNLIQIITSE